MTDETTPSPIAFEPHPTGAPPVGANLGTTPPTVTTTATPSQAEDDSTVGMGTSIALGCVAATILLIVIGLIVLLAVNLVG